MVEVITACGHNACSGVLRFRVDASHIRLHQDPSAECAECGHSWVLRRCGLEIQVATAKRYARARTNGSRTNGQICARAVDTN